MKFNSFKIYEFNGYLYSLRDGCNVLGFDGFCQQHDFTFNKVKKLCNSDLHGSNYVLSILYSSNFEQDFNNLIEKNKKIPYRIEKYRENSLKLLEQLEKAKKSYCGIGLNKVKIILNDIYDYDDTILPIIMALEIENTNILAKNSSKKYSKYLYFKKQNLILDFVQLCQENNINYGFLESDIPFMNSIILFDLPCGQISWHTKLEIDENHLYDKQWDSKELSTFNKLENYILKNYII